jgi:dihydroorotate dehydrogenase (fumarate)
VNPDLSTSYLGLGLSSPVVASASPLTGDVGSLRALEAAGAGAVVLPSLFEEQLTSDSLEIHDLLETGVWSHPEATGYIPELTSYNTGPEHYLRLVERAKQALRIPVIASLNGSTPGGWVRYATLIEEAGADAIELNAYRVAAGLDDSPRSVENDVCAVVESVVAAVDVPVAVKLGPFFSAFGHLAKRLETAGARGLVLFNRFYQPDIDLESLSVQPRLVLSTSDELRLPLRWVAILAGRLRLSLAITTGVHTAEDVAKSLLAGADVAMMTSALLRHGPGHVTAVLDGLSSWMAEREYVTVGQLVGSVSQRNVEDPSAFERANYMAALTGYASRFRA